MLHLQKPQHLKPGDKVATVSLSWGAAGVPEIRWRYELGKRRMEEQFGLQVVEMPHTLAPEKYVSDHPEKRAEDLMAAFADPSIKAVFNVIGGSDSVRMLPYIDFDVIRSNPKIFTGYSDGTTTDFICMKAGIASFYGAHVLNDFAEPGKMHDYTAGIIRKMLFSNETVGEIAPMPEYSQGDVSWTDPSARRTYTPDWGYACLQGGVARGTLIGGCFEVFPDFEGNELDPPSEAFDGSILFYEVCGKPSEEKYRTRLRHYGEKGWFKNITGLLMGKPLGDRAEHDMLNRVTLEVLAEFGRPDLPVLANAGFGHNAPSGVIPMGAMAEIDCDRGRFTILENVTL